MFQINYHISVNGDVIFITDWHRHTQKQKCEGLPAGVNSTTWRVVLLMLCYIPLTEDITNQSKFDIILFLNVILTHNIYQTHDLTLGLINSLHPNISTHILHTVLDTYFKVLTRRICLPNQKLLSLVIISYILMTLMSDSEVIL